MSKSKLVVLIILTTVITAVFGQYIKIGSVRPDILFTFVLCFAALSQNVLRVMIQAAVCGAISDCMCGRIFGNYTAVFLICAVIVYIIKDVVYKDNFLVSILLVFLCTLIGKSLFYVINISTLKETGYFFSLTNIILPEALFNSVLSCAMLPIIKWLGIRKAGYR